jgi:beta-phosphoglucomutase family hydrolase
MSERFQGAVFDMNGTLVDDIRYHFEAWQGLSKRLGHEMDATLFQSFNGLKNDDIFPRLLGRPVSADELATLAEEKEEVYRELYRPHLSLVKGAKDLLDRCRARGIRLAIASSAPPKNRSLVIEGLGLSSSFDAVVEAEHLPGKPAPDVFIEAARRLGIAPACCVAFEDAENGVRSAVSAGMFVVGVTTNNDAKTLLSAGARVTISDFTTLPEEVEKRM